MHKRLHRSRSIGKRWLVNFLLRRGKSSLEQEFLTNFWKSTIPNAAVTNEVSIFPQSFAQQRLWFLDQLEPGSATYNIPVAVHLRGPLNIEALERSFNEIVRRHEALRTVFSIREGQPVQIVAPYLQLRLAVLDLEKLPESEREGNAIRLAREEAARPFDLARGPLVRTSLLRLGAAEHFLLLTIHHIVADGWSKRVLFRELSALYNAFCGARPSPLAELPIQYADFAIWQRNWLVGSVLETQLSYWKRQLHGAPAVLELPADAARPALQTFNGSRKGLLLPVKLADALKLLSRQEDVTLFMTLLAAFKVLLHRYTGQEDIVVGTAIAGRNRSELEGLIGFFVNTLALRSDLTGNPSFRELLRRVREIALGAYSYQDLPFEKLVEELDPQRNLKHSPLFQVMFIFQNTPSQILTLSGLTLTHLEIDSGTSKFDLTLSMEDSSDGLRTALEYNTDIFESRTIERLLGHFQTLLEGIVADPGRPISELPLLTAAERNQLLVAWNATEADYASGSCLHELFESQVERTPESVAIVSDEERLTYDALNRRANQLSNYLRTRGVKTETLVAVCLERGIEMVVGILGVLKAGAAYVPLDPSYPKERLQFMVEDAQIQVLLTQERLRAVWPESLANVICLDSSWDAIADQKSTNPSFGVTSENLAYVIYTSGSTGKPKGVQILHRSVVNFLKAMDQQPGLTNQDSLLAITTLSFDIAVLEIFLPLTVGAKVIIASRTVASDGRELFRKLRDSCATVMQGTPATWRLLLEAGWKGHPQLKVLCGGEVLPEALKWQLLSKALEVWNLYGPTETTIWSTTCKIYSHHDTPSIGQPIANTEIYILDRHLQPVPVGVQGELYIGGDGLARGYWRRPDLTAERFVPNEFSDQPGARLYKTGDLARYRANGQIEFLGRLDQQVKIRGFRIELGEIEAVLGSHPSVRECVVTSYDFNGERRLAAYVTLHGSARPSVAEFRRHLATKLPEYMTPSSFVMMEELPLTPNGKVNRRALPVPGPHRPALENILVDPRSQLEEMLAKIWCEVLGLEKVGVRDDFFQLGGHSLLAISLFVKIEKSFGKKLPLSSIFSAPTIEGLAALLGDPQQRASSILGGPQLLPSSGCLVVLQEKGANPPLFCVAGIGAQFSFRRLALHLGDSQPVYALQFPGLDGQREPLTSFQEIASEFIREMQQVQPRGPYFLSGLCSRGLVTFEIAQQLIRQGQSIALLALFDTFVPGFGRRRTKRKERIRLADNSTTLVKQIDRVRGIITKAARRYQPQPYPGRLILFRPSKRSWEGADPLNGWGPLVSGGIETYSIEGHHRHLFREPMIRVTASRMRTCLLAAQGQIGATQSLSRVQGYR